MAEDERQKDEITSDLFSVQQRLSEARAPILNPFEQREEKLRPKAKLGDKLAHVVCAFCCPREAGSHK